MGRTIWVVAVTVVVAILVIEGTHAFARDAFGDLLVQLFATFVGAVLALAAGLYLFLYQAEETDSKRREELRDLVRAELEETAQELKDKGATDYEDTSLVYIQPLMIEQAAKSGLFTTSLTRKLLSLARQFHTYNGKVRDLLAIPAGYDLDSQEGKSRLTGAARGTAGAADEVIERCGRLLQDPEIRNQQEADELRNTSS